jgi:exosome complex exonuclease DIS3/RRP44
MNRALEGDVVVVRILPRAEWSVSGGRVGGRSASGPRGETGGVGEEEQDELAQPDRLGGVRVAPEMAGDADEPQSGSDARPCAAVVGVVKRERRTYPCVLDPESAIGSQHLAEPLDARVPKINITTRQVRAWRVLYSGFYSWRRR